MKKQDTRTKHPEVQYELRKIVIRLRQQGASRKAVARITGISPTHVSTLWQAYQRGGMDAMRPKVRGRKPGQKRRLTPEQEQEIQRLILEHTPDEVGLSWALWTREAVRQLIRERYGLDLPLRTITDYLARWKFTPQKPVRNAYEQNPNHIARWLVTDYPAIVRRARKEKAEIYWGDETGISCRTWSGRGFAPKGRPPVLRIHARRMHISMISAINNSGTVRFMLYRNALNASRLITFLSRLITDAPRKVFLILDNLSVHHSKRVRTWVDAHQEQIAVFYLPAYAPEYNPNEYLNSNLKQKMGSRLPSRSLDDLTRGTRSFMRTLQRRPHHVKSFFLHPTVAYAA